MTLLVAIITLIVSVLTLVYSLRRDKRAKISLINRKKARLEAMKKASKVGVTISEMGGVIGNIAALEADIDQLKNMIIRNRTTKIFRASAQGSPIILHILKK